MATTTEQEFEKVIQDKGLTAPRVTPRDVDAEIVHEQYHVFPGTTTTVAALTLRNGTVVVGESACVSPANFDESIGKSVAYNNARDKVWALLGFRLRDLISGYQGK